MISSPTVKSGGITISRRSPAVGVLPLSLSPLLFLSFPLTF
jgi:hypothetical protein